MHFHARRASFKCCGGVVETGGTATEHDHPTPLEYGEVDVVLGVGPQFGRQLLHQRGKGDPAAALLTQGEDDAAGTVDDRSTNVTETFRRVIGEHEAVELELLDTAHVFAAGHRIRLTVAGGWFPFYSRNPGTRENPLTAETLHPNRHTVTFGEGTALVLPTLPTPPTEA